VDGGLDDWIPCMRRPWPLALVVIVGCLLTAAMIRPAAAQPHHPQTPSGPAGPVVLLGVPDLRWEDVAPETTPTLWLLAGRASVAALTARSGERATRAAGWLTLNTGSRAVARVDAQTVPAPAAPNQLQALREANQAAAYRSQVGALGDALTRAGHVVATVGGPGAVLGAMTGDGTVERRAPSVAVALTRADIVVVELPQLYTVDRRDPLAVQGALTAIDQAVATALAELPRGGTLLIAGVSEGATGRAHLHVAMASGPAYGPGRLTSASTGRTGVVQLIDAAPTLLDLVGTPAPPVMLGAPWRTVPGSALAPAQAVAGFVDLDRRSVTTQIAVDWYYPAVAWTALLYVALVLLAWRRGRTRLLRPLGAVLAAVPIAGYLAQLVPWWRVGSWPLAPLTVGIAAVVGLGAAAVPWARRHRWGVPALVGGCTAVVLAADAATGSPLSLDAPFADNPIVAGRFHGLGNVAFALFATGTLIAAAALAADRPPRLAAPVVFGLGGLAVVIDGLPSLGDDLGGGLALVPAVAVLGFAVSRVRVSVRHVLAVLAATVLITVGFALYDFSRPPADRTHLGRFIGQIGEGVAGVTLRRKLDTSLSTFTWGFARWIVLGWLVLALVAWAASRAGRLRVPATVDHRTAGGLLLSLVVLVLLGAALNDSGLEVPAFAFYLAAPLLVPFLEPVPQPAAPPSPVPRVEGHAGSTRT
jgi:hypothetical protein